MKQYKELLKNILDNGIEKEDRTGTGTISIFGYQFRHKMSDGFPMITTKHISLKNIQSELIWFLQGRTDLRWLLEKGNTIWVGDAYKRYEQNWMQENPPFSGPYLNPCLTREEFIEKIKTDNRFNRQWGDLGKIYGYQWRNWGAVKIYGQGESILSEGVDQISNLISELKTNPDSRRLMVNAWNIGELDQMILPPCHYGFQIYTRELSLEERSNIWNKSHNPVGNVYTHNQYDENSIPKRSISLMWNQRSVDTGLGLPYNIASYALLLEILAKTVNMVPDELIGNLGDCHIYSDHIEGIKEQLTREPYPLPKLQLNPIFLANLEYNGFDAAIEGEVNFKLIDYKYHPKINLPLSN
jgi:thymidylate synthase